MSRKSAVALLALLFLLMLPPAEGSSLDTRAAGVELVGVLTAGAPLNGAMLSGDRLYATTPDRLSIFDVSDPTLPVLLASKVSANPVYGEQISTNDELLLLNSFTSGSTLDVWNVEDATNPVVVGTITGVPDEHVSCVLDCTWAYGSEGSVIDLRRPSSPELIGVNWKDELGIEVTLHRVDEYRRGFITVAQRGPLPLVVDVRDPHRPHLIGLASAGAGNPKAPFLYSDWPLRGRGRYLVASVEGPMTRECERPTQGVLVSFDTKGWPRRGRFPLADRYAPEAAEGCTGVYFSEHPRFAATGLIAQAVGLDGMRLVRMDDEGHFTEVASFEPLVGDVWHTYWADKEIVYVTNLTGEIYILRYTP